MAVDVHGQGFPLASSSDIWLGIGWLLGLELFIAVELTGIHAVLILQRVGRVRSPHFAR